MELDVAHKIFFAGGLGGRYQAVLKASVKLGTRARLLVCREDIRFQGVEGALNKAEVSVTQNHTFVYQITRVCVAGVFDKVVVRQKRVCSLIPTVGNWPKARQSPHWPLSVPEVHKLQETAQEGPNCRLFFFLGGGGRMEEGVARNLTPFH